MKAVISLLLMMMMVMSVFQTVNGRAFGDREGVCPKDSLSSTIHANNNTEDPASLNFTATNTSPSDSRAPAFQSQETQNTRNRLRSRSTHEAAINKRQCHHPQSLDNITAMAIHSGVDNRPDANASHSFTWDSNNSSVRSLKKAAHSRQVSDHGQRHSSKRADHPLSQPPDTLKQGASGDEGRGLKINPNIIRNEEPDFVALKMCPRQAALSSSSKKVILSDNHKDICVSSRISAYSAAIKECGDFRHEQKTNPTKRDTPHPQTRASDTSFKTQSHEDMKLAENKPEPPSNMLTSLDVPCLEEETPVQKTVQTMTTHSSNSKDNKQLGKNSNAKAVNNIRSDVSNSLANKCRNRNPLSRSFHGSSKTCLPNSQPTGKPSDKSPISKPSAPQLGPWPKEHYEAHKHSANKVPSKKNACDVMEALIPYPDPKSPMCLKRDLAQDAANENLGQTKSCSASTIPALAEWEESLNDITPCSDEIHVCNDAIWRSVKVDKGGKYLLILQKRIPDPASTLHGGDSPRLEVVSSATCRLIRMKPSSGSPLLAVDADDEAGESGTEEGSEGDLWLAVVEVKTGDVICVQLDCSGAACPGPEEKMDAGGASPMGVLHVIAL